MHHVIFRCALLRIQVGVEILIGKNLAYPVWLADSIVQLS